jgi:hypothetical protein
LVTSQEYCNTTKLDVPAITSYEIMDWDLNSMQQFEKELKAFSLFLHNEPALA